MNCFCIDKVHSYFRFNREESASGLLVKQRLFMLPQCFQLYHLKRKFTIGLTHTNLLVFKELERQGEGFAATRFNWLNNHVAQSLMANNNRVPVRSKCDICSRLIAEH